ncbi:alpha/beta fold hydrolase [Bacillus xiapuensis]|uniref:alpha/beta fold hydrolase n=1 Tax=Bacillus xiapuensis TaxID=2014075 RepID=UPI0012FE0BA6|nr:alpha/beta fold hydrolase [Bacillus xiapuensis]
MGVWKKNGVIALVIIGLVYFSYWLLNRAEPASPQAAEPPADATLFIHGHKGTYGSFRTMLERFEHNSLGKKTLICKVTKDGRVLVKYANNTPSKEPQFIQVLFENNRAGFDQTAYWLSKIMKMLKVQYDLKQVNLVGHSMGGLVSAKYLQNYSHHRDYPAVKHLVVIGSPFLGVSDKDYVNKNTGLAKYDLMPNSPALQEIFHHKRLFPNNVKTLAIASTGDQLVAVQSALAVKQLVPKDHYHEIIIRDSSVTHSGLHESRKVDLVIAEFLWKSK